MRRLVGSCAGLLMAVTSVTLAAAPAQAAPDPQLVLTSLPAWPRLLDPTRIPTVTVQVTGLGDQAGELTVPGAGVQTVHDADLVTVNLADVADGTGVFRIRVCAEAQPCLTRAREVEIRRSLGATIYGTDHLLNENGDGFWESATPMVTVDPAARSAQWSIVSGSRTVAGPFALTAQQLRAAQNGGVSVPVSSRTVGRVLAAGDYSFVLRVAEPEVARVTLQRWSLRVSRAGSLGAPRLSTPVVHPLDIHPGVAHEARASLVVDPRVLSNGVNGVEVVDANGRVMVAHLLKGHPKNLVWDGYTNQPTGRLQLAPEGFYRIRLRLSDNGENTPGPASAPFRLSHERREIREVSTKPRKISTTRRATRIVGQASVRATRGRLHYRSANPSTGVDPAVRTTHVIAVPAGVREAAVFRPTVLRVRGAWENPSDVRIDIITPKGRSVDTGDRLMVLSRREHSVSLKKRWIRPDGTVQFRLTWDGLNRGRVDSASVLSSRYVWVR